MDIKYFRSSSLGSWEYCQLKYFLVYNLGLQEDTNQKTEQGTIAHKVFEILAKLKKLFQETNADFVQYEDEVTGKLKVTKEGFLKPTILDTQDIVKTNLIRSNNKVFLYKCLLKDGHTRLGVDMVEFIIKKAYSYYVKKSKHKWEESHFLDCREFVWIGLEFNKGQFDPRLRTIVETERFFDITLNKNWSDDLKILGTIDLITELNKDTLEIVDWKGLPVDTPLPTPNGWTTMGDVKIGDTLFDKDGNPTKVLGKSKKNFKPCYKITFDDKTEVICDNEHLWLLDDNKVVPVTELKIKDKISINKPIITDKIELPIDPYVLGLWLGDGRNKNGEISNGDQFIFDKIRSKGYTLGENLDNSPSNCESRTVYGLVTQLKKFNLLHNKHIPQIYLRSSFEQRLELLHGLMDSDGNVNSIRKQAVFTNCNKKLSDDVKELLISLGQRVNQGDIERDYKDTICKVYPLHFRPININPFSLPRKADQIKDWGSGISHRRLIKNIELLSIQLETQCIMVDSPSNTYLCTENMIPTHNTGQRKDWATGLKKDSEKLHKDTQLLLYYYVVRHLYPQYKHVAITIFFLRDGGPFPVILDDAAIVEIENRLKSKYKEIKSCNEPKLLDEKRADFRCYRLCTFFKNGMCEKIHQEIKEFGIDYVSHNNKSSGFELDKYSSPGE